MDRFLHYSTIIRVLLLGAVLAAGCSPQSKTARHLARAEKYLAKQKPREAVIEYMNVLRADPTNQVATRRMGLALFDTGDLRTALPYLQKAGAIDPSDSETGWKLGSVYLAMGDRVQARKKAEDVLARNRDHVDAIVLFAGAAASSNEIDGAVGMVQSAISRMPQQTSLNLTLGALYVQQRNLAAAEDVYKKALQQDAKAWKPHLALGDLYLLKRDSARAEQEYKTAAELSPAESLARIRFARFQWANRKPREARAILEEVTKESPEFIPAWMQLAQFAFSERDFDMSSGILTRILKQAPAHIDAFLLLQRVKVAQGKIEEAVDGYERLVAAAPNFAAGRFFLGAAYLQKGDLRKAVDALQKTVELNPDYIDAIAILSELYIRMGNTDAALTLLNNLIRRHPDAGLAYALIGSAHSSRREFAKAADVYRKLMALMPENPQGPYLLGMTLRRLDKPQEAIAMFEMAMKLAPGFLEPLDQLVTMELERTGKWDVALDRIRKQIALAPEQAGLHYLLGITCFRKSDWEQAERSLLKAIELQPELTGAYLVLGQVYVATHQDVQALARIEKALTINSNDVAALMMKGTILERKNETKKAVEQYQRVLAVNPRYFPAANNLAYLYGNDPGMKDKAFELARQARELAPKDPFVADTLGWIVYSRGEYKWALSLLQESADRLPKQAEVLYHLGMCQCALGNEQAARETLTASLEASRDFAGRDQAAEVLALVTLNPEAADAAARGKVEAFLAKYPDNALGWVRLGAFQEKGGDYPAAQKSYEKAVSLNSQYVPGLLRLVGLYTLHQQNLEKAWVLAKQAREAAPGDARIADALAWVAFKRGDHKWAHSLLAESIGELPDDPAIQYHFALANYVLGRVDVATPLLQKAVSSTAGFQEIKDAERMMAALKNPETERTFLAEGDGKGTLSPLLIPIVLSDASIALRKGDLAGAQKGYERIISRYPEFIPAIRELVLIYGTQKEPSEEKFKLVAKARELLPQDPYIAVALGKVAYRQGQYAYASRLLKESTSLLSTSSEVYYYLGMSQHQLRDMKSARISLQRAIELDPKAEWSESARNILSKIK